MEGWKEWSVKKNFASLHENLRWGGKKGKKNLEKSSNSLNIYIL